MLNNCQLCRLQPAPSSFSFSSSSLILELLPLRLIKVQSWCYHPHILNHLLSLPLGFQLLPGHLPLLLSFSFLTIELPFHFRSHSLLSCLLLLLSRFLLQSPSSCIAYEFSVSISLKVGSSLLSKLHHLYSRYYLWDSLERLSIQLCCHQESILLLQE